MSTDQEDTMQTKALKIGETYAIKQYKHATPFPARLLAIGPHHPVKQDDGSTVWEAGTGEYRWRRRSSAPQHLFEKVADKGQVGYEARQVYSTWADWEAERDEHARRHAAAKEREAAALAARLPRYNALADRLVTQFPRGEEDYWIRNLRAGQSSSISFTPQALADLLDIPKEP
jgi:hypothetical protein